MNTENFIQKAIDIHGDTYDYTDSNYINSDTKISIKCKIHGEFKQRAVDHIRGRGCNKCAILGRAKKCSNKKELFVKQSKEKHGEKYDYSQVEYKNNKSKVKIICSKHGVFEQIAQDHTRGAGCRKCSADKRAKSFLYTNEEFINKAKKLHGNKYDYSSTVYVKSDKLVDITCKTHGKFKQTPTSHLSGKGCAKCGNIATAIKNSMGRSDFFQKAKAMHNDKYSYNENFYTKATGDIKIICPTHGEFTQKGSCHLRGNGCPKCNIPIGYTQSEFIQKYKDRLTALYIVSFVFKNEKFIKIGITGNTIINRFAAEKKKYKINTIISIEDTPDNIWKLENWLHQKLKNYLYIPVNKLKSGNTECFTLKVLEKVNYLLLTNPHVNIEEYYKKQYNNVVNKLSLDFKE